MQQTVLLVQDGNYPFGKGFEKAQVKQIQRFTSSEAMREKKIEMIKKSEMITSQFIIRMTFILQQQKSLLYYYEFVEHSIGSFLRLKHQGKSVEIWTMTKTLLLKKLAYQLTMLISYLGKMKIEVDLSLSNLGFNKQQKLKIYVSPRCKMGIKTEIQLFAYYNKAKEKVMKDVQGLIASIDQGIPRQPVQSQQTIKNQSRIKTQQSKEKQSFKAKFKKIPKLDTSGSHLRQTRTFQESNQYRKRKMSSGNFDLGSGQPLKMGDRPTQHKNTQKKHKLSYQYCGTQPDQPFYTNNKYQKQQPQEQENIGIAQSKSIKIELQQTQNQNPHEKKARKDSYKVKITTFRQYEVEGNPGDLFGMDPNSSEDHIFDYFAKKAKNQEKQQQQKEQQENLYQRSENIYQKSASSSDKNRKQTGQTNFSTNNVNPEPPSPLSPVWSLPSKGPSQTIKSPKLEQRIKQAKQRTNKALNLIKALKK